MSHWDNAVAGTRGQATQEDFEAAAYRLVAEQVLYASDRGNKLPYWLIEDHEREFRHALEPMGVGLLVNRRLRYACALPRHTKIADAGLEPTLLALVLRKIYDELAWVRSTMLAKYSSTSSSLRKSFDSPPMDATCPKAVSCESSSGLFSAGASRVATKT